MTTTSRLPKNNLGIHLAWLIREKPTIPPQRADKPAVQSISTATLAAIESQSRNSTLPPLHSGPFSRSNSVSIPAPAPAQASRYIGVDAEVPEVDQSKVSEPSRSSHSTVQQIPQPPGVPSVPEAAATMPLLTMAQTPVVRRKLTVPRKTSPEDDDDDDPFEPVARTKSSKSPAPSAKKPGESLLDKYSKHCADDKVNKTPAMYRTPIPAGPVESIDLTMSDDDDIPNLPTSRFRRENSARSATATPSRTTLAIKTLPVGSSDPPPPYSTQEMATPVPRRPRKARGKTPSRGTSTLDEETEETEETITTVRKSTKTKRRLVSETDEQATKENFGVQASQAASKSKTSSKNAQGVTGATLVAVAAGVVAGTTKPRHKAREIVFDSENDGDDGNFSDQSLTMDGGSGVEENPVLNSDAPRPTPLGESSQPRITPAMKCPSPKPIRAREQSPKVSFEDALVLKSSPLYRSPQRTKRMAARNGSPDPRELSRNLSKILSPSTGRENIQSTKKQTAPPLDFDLDASLEQKKKIEADMAGVKDMIQLYTAGKYEGSLTLIQMAMKYEDLQRILADLERPAHGFLASAVDIEQTQESSGRATPDRDAVDVYATQHIVKNTPLRNGLQFHGADGPTQFVRQTQYHGGHSNSMSGSEIIRSTMPVGKGDVMDVDDSFEMAISSMPDAEPVTTHSQMGNPIDNGKYIAAEDDYMDRVANSRETTADDVPDEFIDSDNIGNQIPAQNGSKTTTSLNLLDMENDDFEFSPEEWEHALGQTSNNRPGSPSEDSDIQVLEKPPPNIFETRAKQISQFAKDEDGNTEDLDLDDVDLGTQRAFEVDVKAPEMQYPWSHEVHSALTKVFKLKGFRANQLNAINATLNGDDVFVLMPTGGGKSLCYQLPAVIRSGKTRGITFVISPLLSLMEDQVAHLRANNINAFMFNSSVDPAEKKIILSELNSRNAADSVQLLYITPEMLAKSKTMEKVMLSLYERKIIARVVIDEAHCVSQWGHDFRPDYKDLGKLRYTFGGVPFIALTATATPRVRVDTMTNLSMKGCKVYKQSFNRPNLYYEVRQKGKEAELDREMATLIKSTYNGKCGIVYCLSRTDCEKVASKLQGAGIRANYYHAGLVDVERREVQQKWQRGELKVIVATIAFGMGIDKADVRFVIHHSMPKSLEGYYQETGRAGRDGKASGCYLFWNFGDVKKLDRMIENSDNATPETIKNGKEMLKTVQQFCHNQTDCRRLQVLHYFGETFDKADCNKTCDNCKSPKKVIDRVITEETKIVISMMTRIGTEKITMTQAINIFRGSKAKEVVDKNWHLLPGHGAGKQWDRSETDRLWEKLVIAGVLEYHHHQNGMGFTTAYIRLGPKAHLYRDGKKAFTMQVEASPTAPSKKPRMITANQEEFQSTFVSSPIAPTRGKKKVPQTLQFTQPDEDGFMPVRDNASKKRKSDGVVDDAPAPRRKKVVAQPIGREADNIRAGLNEYDLDVLERFLKDAKRVRGDLSNERGLRIESIFTDTELSYIGVKLPCSINELVAMPEIQDKERIRLYGSKFLPISQKYSNEKLENYEGTHFTQAANSQLPGVEGFREDDFDEDFEDEEDEEEEQGSTSHYFNGEQSQSAKAFAARLDASSKGKAPAKRATSKARGGRGASGKSGAPRKAYTRRSGGGGKSQRGGRGGGRGGSKAFRGGGGGASGGVRPMPM